MTRCTTKELTQLTKTMWKMDPMQLAALSGAALGLAARKAQHTVIPADHWMLRHLSKNYLGTATSVEVDK